MKKTILVLMSVLCLGMLRPLSVRADEAVGEVEISELNQIMTAKDNLEIKENPDDNAATVITYESGAAVFVVGETADGWYKVSYQDKAGYVRKEELVILELDVEGIDNEMTEVTAEGKQVVEEVERYRTESRRTKIWGTVIIILVIGIFATGVVSTIKNEKEEEEGDQPDKVVHRKHKVAKSQVKITENLINIEEKKKNIDLKTEERDTFRDPDRKERESLIGSDVKERDTFRDPDRKKRESLIGSDIKEWDSLGDSEREQWDMLINSDKEEWDCLGDWDREEWDSLTCSDKNEWKWD